MIVCCISDTHGSHEELNIPKCDLLLHAGDFSAMGIVQEIITVNNWFKDLKSSGTVDEVVLVPGNHDGLTHDMQNLFTDAKLLMHNSYRYGKYNIFGSHYTKIFGAWHHMKRDDELERLWSQIPDDTDIVVTHQPPFLLLDEVENGSGSVSVGCKHLRYELVNRVKPKLSVFGHLHLRGGSKVEHNGTTYVNAAVNNENYIVSRQPILIEL